MADTIKRLANISPAATTLTSLFVVPSGVAAAVSSVVICNMNATEQTVRLSHATGGAADSPEQYLYYDTPIAANDTFVATIGPTLSAADVLRCYASATGINFHVYGALVS